MAVKPTPPSPARDKVRAVVPKLIDLTENVLFGDVWERPGLSKRDRSLITCAALVALTADPAIVNSDPMGAGWLYKLKLAEPKGAEALLDEAAYNALTGGSDNA